MRLFIFFVFALVLAAPVAKAQDITTGLAHHWKLDETTGNTVVDSVGGVDGSFYIHNGPPSPDIVATGGIDGMAVQLVEGNMSSVTIPDGPHFDFGANSFTVSLWAKKQGPSTSHRDCILCTDGSGNSGSTGLEIFSSANPDDSGENVYILDDADVDPRINLNNEQMLHPWNQWKHFVLVVDRSGDIATFYTDGAYSNQTSISGAGNIDFWRHLNLGARDYDNDNWFHGLFDDVRIYNRALTPEDVQALYQEHICLNPKGFQAQMRFNAAAAVMEYCDGDQWVAMGPKEQTAWKQLDTGGWAGCAVSHSGRLECWGGVNQHTEAVTNVPTGKRYQKVALGYSYGCALGYDGSIDCWTSDLSADVVVNAPSGVGYTDIAAVEGSATACAISAGGALECWGSDEYNVITNLPAGADFQSVHGGWRGFCAVRTDNTMHCWSGWVTDAGDYPDPKYVQGVTHHGWNCAVLTDGSVECWGNAGEPEVDDAPSGNSFTYIESGGRSADTTCAITKDNVGICWGKQIGANAIGNSPYADVVDVAVYSEGACFIRTNGTIFCSGSNYSGMKQYPGRPPDCPDIGDVCADGSVFAGFTPDGNV